MTNDKQIEQAKDFFRGRKINLKGSLEYARLNVEGATHNNNEPPSARMRDLYEEHGFRDKTMGGWGNGVLNGPVNKLKLVENDLEEKHPSWKLTYDMHRPALSEQDLEDFNVGDKVLTVGIKSWTGHPFVAQGTVIKAEHNGYRYAQYSTKNHLIIKTTTGAKIEAGPEEQDSDVEQIAKLDKFLPPEVIHEFTTQLTESKQAEGHPSNEAIDFAVKLSKAHIYPQSDNTTSIK